MHNVYVNRMRASRSVEYLDEAMLELQHAPTQTDALTLRDLDRALASLPTDQREVLLLVALEEMSYADAARSLGVPIGTVMSRLSRAREKLRVLMMGGSSEPKLKRVK
jgi:RNA polymerase sigma-70 factor (ECF subfamily)